MTEIATVCTERLRSTFFFNRLIGNILHNTYFIISRVRFNVDINMISVGFRKLKC